MWKATTAACAAMLIVTLAPAPALATTVSAGYEAVPPTYFGKPALPSHADTPPRLPGADALAAPRVVGAIDPAESGRPFDPGPLGSASDAPHPLDNTISGGAGSPLHSGDGLNSITFGAFEAGDIIVVLDGGSPTGHAGLFDDRYYSGLTSFAIWSANVTPVNGVQREQCLKFRYYDDAYGLDVPSKRAYRFQARDFAARQKGKPYSVFATKTDTRSFYCSKLAWAAYYYAARLDLDSNRGFWVWPADLVQSASTRLFGHWS